MDEHNKKGYITELQVISELIKYGDVSIPYGNNSRYDCILDYNKKLLKIQIKTAKRLSDRKFLIPMCNTQTNRNVCRKKKYDPEDVDFVATIYENVVYLVPVTRQCTGITLSTVATNWDIKRTNLASDFRIDNILK